MEGTLSGGKKWASGTSTLSSTSAKFTYSGTTVVLAKPYIDITLNFTPSIILVSCSKDSSGFEYLSILNNMGQIFNKSNVKVSIYDEDSYSNSVSTYNFKNDSSVSLGNNVYRIPIHSTSLTNITWIAYE